MVSASRCVDGVGAAEPLSGAPQHEVGRRDRAPTTARRRASSRSTWCSIPRSPPTAPKPRRRQHRQPVGDVHARRARRPDVSARLVPLQEPKLMGYAAYVAGRLHPHRSTDAQSRVAVGISSPDRPIRSNRLSQRLDLTQPIPEMQATPPTMPAQATQLMASKGYQHIYNGAWIFASEDNRNAWDTDPWNFLPRVGVNYRLGDDVGGAIRLRALPDADQQRSRHARRLRQPVCRLRADDEHAGARERRAAADAVRPVPVRRATR